MSAATDKLATAGAASVARSLHDPALREKMDLALRAWHATKSPHTIRARMGDLRAFGRFVTGENLGPIDCGVLLYSVLEAGLMQAEALVADWLDSMAQKGHEPTSICRRLSTVKTLSSTLQRFGVPWSLAAINGPKYDPYTRVTGPPAEDVKAVIDRLEEEAMGPDPWRALQAARDCSIISLLYHTGIRRGAIEALVWGDVRLGAKKMRTALKGGGARWQRISGRNVRALRLWNKHRAGYFGPVRASDPAFLSLRGRNKGGRLGGRAVHYIVHHAYDLGSPHKIRHASATELVRLSNGNTHVVKDHLGHKSLANTQIYVDAIGDGTEEGVRLLAEEDAE